MEQLKSVLRAVPVWKIWSRANPQVASMEDLGSTVELSRSCLDFRRCETIIDSLRCGKGVSILNKAREAALAGLSFPRKSFVAPEF
jgi:hypothetical protein